MKMTVFRVVESYSLGEAWAMRDLAVIMEAASTSDFVGNFQAILITYRTMIAMVTMVT